MDPQTQMMVRALKGTYEGMPSRYKQFRPSTNVEDSRNKPLWQNIFENTFEMSPDDFTKMVHHPMTPMSQLIADYAPHSINPDISTSFGLPDTVSAINTFQKNFTPAGGGPDLVNYYAPTSQNWPVK